MIEQSPLISENSSYETIQIYRGENICFLKLVDAGMSVNELCRSGGFSQPTFYKWRSRFCGMESSDTVKLRELEAENNKLEKLLAEAHLDFML